MKSLIGYNYEESATSHYIGLSMLGVFARDLSRS